MTRGAETTERSRLLHGGVDWNYIFLQGIYPLIPSPPSRRRGLKWQEGSATEKQTRSPPSRRRGLKFKKADAEAAKKGRLLHGGVDWNMKSMLRICDIVAVASFTEAWIEILDQSAPAPSEPVASFTEAWIEIYICISSFKIKPVASFTEAWIEIGNPHCSSRCCYIVSSQR